MTRFSYSAPLDSVRALAVLSVIVFHFSASLLPGGYLGVDLFFVLSSLLITSIILQDGTDFSFKTFYTKRIKRILPPLYVMLFITSLAGAIFLAKEDFNRLKESTELILVFGANLFFARQGSGYFDPQISEIPLLHTWSLAIEEQFYFIWPVLIIGLLKTKPRYRFMIVLALAAACFGYSEWTIHSSNANQVYYSAIGRFGQMLLGSLGALLVFRTKEVPKSLGNILFALGLGGFGYYILFFEKSATYPGLSAIGPTLACLMVVLGSYYASGKLKEVLSNSTIVWIGKISFSLYLWHWPILAFARYTTDSNTFTAPLTVFLSVLILVLSVLSYYLVESKTRYLNLTFKKSAVSFFLVPAVLIAILNLGTKEALYKHDTSPANRLYTTRCHDVLRDKCEVGSETVNSSLKILAFGDSHMSHLNGFLDIIGKKEGWSATVVSAGRCHPFLYESGPHKFAPCEIMLQWVRSNIDKYDVILLAGRWNLYPDLNKAMIETSLNAIKGNNRKVVVFSQVRHPPMDPRKRHALVNFVTEKNYGETEQGNMLIANTLEADVRWIDLYTPSLSISEGIDNYYDTNHLSEVGSANLAQEFIKVQERPLIEENTVEESERKVPNSIL